MGAHGVESYSLETSLDMGMGSEPIEVRFAKIDVQLEGSAAQDEGLDASLDSSSEGSENKSEKNSWGIRRTRTRTRRTIAMQSSR